MLVSQILKNKGDLVFTIPPEETVGGAAALLNARRVGALVVLNKEDKVAGIFSERDVVRVLAEHGPGALERPVSVGMRRPACRARFDRRLSEGEDRRSRTGGAESEGVYRRVTRPAVGFVQEGIEPRDLAAYMSRSPGDVVSPKSRTLLQKALAFRVSFIISGSSNRFVLDF